MRDFHSSFVHLYGLQVARVSRTRNQEELIRELVKHERVQLVLLQPQQMRRKDQQKLHLPKKSHRVAEAAKAAGAHYHS